MTIIDSLSASQRAELAEAILARGGAIAEFAAKHGLNANSLRGALSRAGGLAGVQPDEPLEAPAPVVQEPQPARQQATDVLKVISQPPKAINVVTPPKHVTLQKWAYASDFHAPLQDDKWVERLARVGYQLAVPTLIIGGDLADFDSISRHPNDIGQVDINETVQVGGEVLRYLRAVYERIILLPGNHDRRFAKKLDKNLSWRNVVKMMVGDMGGFETTDDDFVYVNGDPGWVVGHPTFFSSRPTVGLQQVALLRGKHVIGAHNHVQGVSIVNDKFITIDPGMMCRRDYTAYYMRGNGLSKLQEWSAGFVVVEDDIPQLFSDKLTRWADFE